MHHASSKYINIYFTTCCMGLHSCRYKVLFPNRFFFIVTIIFCYIYIKNIVKLCYIFLQCLYLVENKWNAFVNFITYFLFVTPSYSRQIWTKLQLDYLLKALNDMYFNSRLVYLIFIWRVLESSYASFICM
jgi:hypothetical protein